MKKLSILLMVLILALAGCADGPTDSPGQKPVPETKAAFLRAHFIDVGQGDAAFIEFPNGKTLLIDAGDVGRGDDVSEYIKSLGYSSIDFLVATHPHADHIGGMPYAVDSFGIGSVYMPNAAASTDVFENLLDAIERKGLKIRAARAGVNILSEPGLTADILAPNAEKYNDLNNYSAAVKISYGETAFIFMGDAEILSENEISGDVRADVVKVGHHGSEYSSDPDFIRRTGAAYAIISVGAGNSYGHPSPLVTENWRKAGAKIYRTDENGTIIAVSDGTDVMISAEMRPEENGESALSENSPNRTEENKTDFEWVLNTNTKKIHYPECRAAAQISPGNYAVTDKTVRELLLGDFTVCGICKPHD
jgi:beta-lactamase superfamily II metal-dependent hydrolase